MFLIVVWYNEAYYNLHKPSYTGDASCAVSMADEVAHLEVVPRVAGARTRSGRKLSPRKPGGTARAAQAYREGSQQNESTSFLW